MTILLSKHVKAGLIGLCLSSLTHPVLAQDSPDFAKFDETVETSLNFPGHYALNLDEVAAIEFWVQPKWTDTLNYNPVILSAIGNGAARYGAMIKGDQKGIGLFSGLDWDYVEFDFSDGFAHHIAFNILGDLTDVYIDGDLIDSLAQGIDEAVETTTFHIGSMNGVDDQFIGNLGQIRFWDTAVDPDDFSDFSKLNLVSKKGQRHPDIDALIGVSTFSDGGRSFEIMNDNESFEESLFDREGESQDVMSQDVIDLMTSLGVDPSTIFVEPTTEDLARLDAMIANSNFDLTEELTDTLGDKK